jgi:hypothetical protein
LSEPCHRVRELALALMKQVRTAHIEGEAAYLLG